MRRPRTTTPVFVLAYCLEGPTGRIAQVHPKAAEWQSLNPKVLEQVLAVFEKSCCS